MRRGDLVIITVKGNYGEPHPTLIIQSDLFSEHPSVTVLPVTSVLREAPLFRITVQPNSNKWSTRTVSNDDRQDTNRSLREDRWGYWTFGR